MRPWNDCKSQGLLYLAHVDPSQISFLCSIVEGHEGLAIVRTKDEALGIVEFWISPASRVDFEEFIRGLGSELEVRLGKPVIPEISKIG